MRGLCVFLSVVLMPVAAFAVKTSRPPRQAPDSIPAVFKHTTVIAGIHGYHYDRGGTLYLNENDIAAAYKRTVHAKSGRAELEDVDIFRVPYKDIEKVLINDEARTALLDGKLPTVPAGRWEYYETVYGLSTVHLQSRPVMEQLRGKNQDAVVILFKQDGKDVSAVMHTLKNYGPAIKKLIEGRKK